MQFTKNKYEYRYTIMSKLKLMGKQIRAIGYPEGPVVNPPKSPKEGLKKRHF